MKTFTIKYRLLFSVTQIEKDWRCRCASPITALNHFHRYMQLDLERMPKDYEIVRLAEVYNDDPSGGFKGRVVESEFDLPKSANPTISKASEPDTKVKDGAFSFLEEAVGGRLAP